MINDNRHSLADVRAVVTVFSTANEGFRDGVLHMMLRINYLNCALYVF